MSVTVGFDTKALDKLIRASQDAQKQIKPEVNKALDKIYDRITEGAEATVKPHKRTGRTEESIVPKQIRWKGQGTVEMGAGYSVRAGGIASIFLMYGTPRHSMGSKFHPGSPKDQAMYDVFFSHEAIEANTKEFKDALQNAILKGLEIKNTRG